MSTEYFFEFAGTRDVFLHSLDQFPHSGNVYYLDDYMVRLEGDEIHVGVERAGHSGGHWFISKMTETDGGITFSGTIQYIGPSSDTEEDSSTGKRIFKKIGLALLFLLVLPPIALIFYIYSFIEWCVRKLRKNAKPKPETLEEKLRDVMQNYLRCVAP